LEPLDDLAIDAMHDRGEVRVGGLCTTTTMNDGGSIVIEKGVITHASTTVKDRCEAMEKGEHLAAGVPAPRWES
jgi:uncharacterized protein (DUF342 family)